MKKGYRKDSLKPLILLVEVRRVELLTSALRMLSKDCTYYGVLTLILYFMQTATDF
jgi:hypothetical protein